jgi:hypothetical protein
VMSSDNTVVHLEPGIVQYPVVRALEYVVSIKSDVATQIDGFMRHRYNMYWTTVTVVSPEYSL